MSEKESTRTPLSFWRLAKRRDWQAACDDFGVTRVRTAVIWIGIASAIVVAIPFACGRNQSADLDDRDRVAARPGVGATLPANPPLRGTRYAAPNDVFVELRNSEAVVVGALEKESIRKVIWERRQQIQYCYEKLLPRFGQLGGEVSVAFVVGPQGVVLQTHIARSTVGNEELERCIAARFANWIFAKPQDGGAVQVTYPVIIHPQPADAGN